MKTVSVREQQDFLLAVVNDSPNVTTNYRGWLPNPTLPSDRQAFARIYEMLYLMKVVTEGNSDWHTSNDPKEFTRDYLKWQTFKLTVIWNQALSSNWEVALSAANNMIVETTRYNAALYAAPWLRKTKQALEWLYENTDKLRRCGIAECKIHPYFIVSPAHKTYCSNICKELAEMARVDERVKQQAAARKSKGAKRRISTLGLKNISEAQKVKWAKNRDAKKEVQ